MAKLIDKYGNPLSRNTFSSLPTKKAFGLMPSIWEPPNVGRYRQRYYVNQDTEIGAGPFSRDLMVRYSREMTAQLPFIKAAIRTLALFSVGTAYLPQYTGNNSAWGETATKWLIEEWYPNCCKRGPSFDFQTVMFIESMRLDVDGDFLCIYGEDADGFPKFQIIPNHRISSQFGSSNGEVVYPTATNENAITPGPFKDTVISDGVVYNMEGMPMGYNVVNPKNLVNSFLGGTKSTFFSAKDSSLIYDPYVDGFIDRGRGFPSLTSGLMQCLSIQEIEAYLNETIKIQSMLAFVESTPSGTGPEEENDVINRMLGESGGNAQTNNNPLSISALSGIALSGGPNSAIQGLQIIDNPYIKYVAAAGGDVKSLKNATPSDETKNHITRLETQILQTIGVPHVLLFSPDGVSGRISDGVISIFNGAIKQRQKVLDKHAKFLIGWAVAKAIKAGILPPNDDENLVTVFGVTHPDKLSLNDSYDRKDALEYFRSGIIPMNDLTTKDNRTAEEVIAQVEKEKMLFFKSAKRISDETGVDLPTVIQSLNDSLKQKSAGGFPAPVEAEPKQ